MIPRSVQRHTKIFGPRLGKRNIEHSWSWSAKAIRGICWRMFEKTSKELAVAQHHDALPMTCGPITRPTCRRRPRWPPLSGREQSRAERRAGRRQSATASLHGHGRWLPSRAVLPRAATLATEFPASCARSPRVCLAAAACVEQCVWPSLASPTARRRPMPLLHAGRARTKKARRKQAISGMVSLRVRARVYRVVGQAESVGRRRPMTLSLSASVYIDTILGWAAQLCFLFHFAAE
jgi:hypothetical protein